MVDQKNRLNELSLIKMPTYSMYVRILYYCTSCTCMYVHTWSNMHRCRTGPTHTGDAAAPLGGVRDLLV